MTISRGTRAWILASGLAALALLTVPVFAQVEPEDAPGEAQPAETPPTVGPAAQTALEEDEPPRPDPPADDGPVRPVREEELFFDEVTGFDEETAASPEDEPLPDIRRVSIVPWEVVVTGKDFDHFDDVEASKVLTGWLIEALEDLKEVFIVGNRDKIAALLAEKGLVQGGYAVSSLAEAGQIQKADFILEVFFTNLGAKIEVTSRLLDVDTSEYTMRASREIGFNPAIESMRSEIDRVVADLATRFPVDVRIDEILSSRRVRIAAGSDEGIKETMEAELWGRDGREPLAIGVVVATSGKMADVDLQRDFPGVSLFEHSVRVKIVPPGVSALRKGQRDFGAGRWDQAVEAALVGLRYDPDSGELHSLLAQALWESGDAVGAVEAFRRALELSPNEPRLLEAASSAFLEAGLSQELSEILAKDDRKGRTVKLTLAYALARESLGFFDEADASYRMALKRRPNLAEAHLRLAVLSAKAGDLEAAGREFTLAGEGGESTLEHELAREAYQLVVEAGDSESRNALRALAGRAEQQGDLQALTTAGEILLANPALWELSLETSRRALEIRSDYARASIAAARALTAGGRHGEAVGLLEKVADANSDNLAFLLLLSRLLDSEGSLDMAEARYRQAQELAPGDGRSSMALGDMYSRQGQHLRAVRAYDSALEAIESSQSGDLTAALHKLGRAAVLANQPEKAGPALERCVDRAPDHADCQFHLGLFYFNEKNLQSDRKAVAAFQAAEEVDDRYRYLGELAERRADFTEAARWYRQCLQSACSGLKMSQERLDRLESIAGTVTDVRGEGKSQTLTLDVGKIHGVKNSQEGVVAQGPRLVARVEVEAVLGTTSVVAVTRVLKGVPSVGQTVRFRPTSPKNLTVTAGQKKGVVVRWRANPEPEVDYYEVFVAERSRGPWKKLKKIKHPTSECQVKTVETGTGAYFRVVAVSDSGVAGPASEVQSSG